jgi:Ras-related protein Rab-6A
LEILHPTLIFIWSFSPTEAALLVFSLNSLESFHCISQHLLEILSLAENAKIFLVGNKCDLQPYEVTDSDIEMFLEQFPKFNGVYKVSCKTNQGIQEMFNDIAEKLASTSYKNSLDALQLHNQETTYGIASNPTPNKDYCCAK